jgi:hypothetical protein
VNALFEAQFQFLRHKAQQRDEVDVLYYELVHNLVLELTRIGIENRNLKMRLESLSSRMDFDERRARALEGVVQYRPGTGPAREPQQPDRVWTSARRRRRPRRRRLTSVGPGAAAAAWDSGRGAGRRVEYCSTPAPQTPWTTRWPQPHTRRGDGSRRRADGRGVAGRLRYTAARRPDR